MHTLLKGDIMFEMLINPVKAEKRPWEMFFIGAFYATVSLFLTQWIFSGDPVLSKYTGMLIVTFCVFNFNVILELCMRIIFPLCSSNPFDL